MVTEEELAARQYLLAARLLDIRARIADVQAKCERALDFVDNAPNLARYEAQLRLAEGRTLLAQLEDLRAELVAADVERRWVEREIRLAGHPISANDNRDVR